MTFFQSFEQFWVVALIIYISQLIYASIGFGAGMFAISLLALFYGKLDYFVPFFILIGLPTELFISLKDRALLNYSNTWYIIVAMLPPLLLGSYLLKKATNVWMMMILGVVIIVLAVYHLFFEKRFCPSFVNKVWAPSFGAISGILGGLFCMGGPPLIFYFKCMKLDKYRFRVTLVSIFLVMTIMRILFYTGFGLFSKRIIFSSLSMLPFGLLGLFTGSKLHSTIPEKLFKKVTSIILLISGVLIIIKNVFMG